MDVCTYFYCTNIRNRMLRGGERVMITSADQGNWQNMASRLPGRMPRKGEHFPRVVGGLLMGRSD